MNCMREVEKIEIRTEVFRDTTCSRDIKLAGRTGLEPATSGVTGRRSNQLNYHPRMNISVNYGRRNRDRTCDPSLVRAVLSQLSYPPGTSYFRRPYYLLFSNKSQEEIYHFWLKNT